LEKQTKNGRNKSRGNKSPENFNIIINVHTHIKPFYASRCGVFQTRLQHMGQISQPQHKNAAAGENADIGPFMRGPM
jgi:hypothetical protein